MKKRGDKIEKKRKRKEVSLSKKIKENRNMPEKKKTIIIRNKKKKKNHYVIPQNLN